MISAISRGLNLLTCIIISSTLFNSCVFSAQDSETSFKTPFLTLSCTPIGKYFAADRRFVQPCLRGGSSDSESEAPFEHHTRAHYFDNEGREESPPPGARAPLRRRGNKRREEIPEELIDRDWEPSSGPGHPPSPDPPEPSDIANPIIQPHEWPPGDPGYNTNPFHGVQCPGWFQARHNHRP
jgi:hypothetical protein